ncbi:hypothetical protein Syun_001561 [Stephania yunnanensis]|uniref:Uncharacterized protein n=1 Tax=Stephania yunnanensis TaxID=152371 RepID=A0AAP0QB11_9MAGN
MSEGRKHLQQSYWLDGRRSSYSHPSKLPDWSRGRLFTVESASSNTRIRLLMVQMYRCIATSWSGLNSQTRFGPLIRSDRAEFDLVNDPYSHICAFFWHDYELGLGYLDKVAKVIPLGVMD